MAETSTLGVHDSAGSNLSATGASRGEVLIETMGLAKSYGDFTAVAGLDLAITAGEVVGFLGPNGAGKTTTMRMLTTYLPPTAGSARVCGYDVVERAPQVRAAIGYAPESPPLYNEMRVRDYLAFVAALKQVPRAQRAAAVDRSLNACSLTDRAGQVIATLSKGYRQRVGLAQAIINDPRVLILDEPTSGLDPHQIIEIRHLIRELGVSRTVLLSTHILQEVVSVCSRVLILHQGRLVHDAPIGDDVAALERKFLELTTRDVAAERGAA